MTTWQSVLSKEKQKPYFKCIVKFLDEEHNKGKVIYPERSNLLNALELTPFKDVKVVILGQDPYHGPNQAHGLSFSVMPGIKPPPSLVNIFKELHSDLGIPRSQHGCLEQWAKQGVLLLNAALSVEASNPQSHAKIGWYELTDTFIQSLNQHPETIVFMLWGASAQKKEHLIDSDKHKILKAPHPSPLSANRGYFGCKHFSKTNKILEEHGRNPINWNLEQIDNI